MIELNTITESKLGSRLEQYRTVISNGSFGYKLAHYIATHYENKELPLMSESHPNSTIKKDPISNRCFSHLSLKHTQNYDNLKAGDFTSFAGYTIASFVVGFLAVFLGLYLVKA